MTVQLLPCPFCGAMPVRYFGPGGAHIFCQNDKGCAVQPSVWSKRSGIDPDAAWNTRATPEAAP